MCCIIYLHVFIVIIYLYYSIIGSHQRNNNNSYSIRSPSQWSSVCNFCAVDFKGFLLAVLINARLKSNLTLDANFQFLGNFLLLLQLIRVVPCSEQNCG